MYEVDGFWFFLDVNEMKTTITRHSPYIYINIYSDVKYCNEVIPMLRN